MNSAKVDQLLENLSCLDSLLVAFSGGADSAFLLAAAAKALGTEKVHAATALSSSLPASEADAAANFAASLGIAHHQPHTNELDREGYRRNEGDRCFFCKTELMSVLGPLAEQLGITNVATGTNADDTVAGFRPGIQAADRLGALTPLADAGFTKDDVRTVSQQWGLSTWDKPAAACLSSRIAFGIPITKKHLDRVGQAEKQLRETLLTHGYTAHNLRVRDLGEDKARIDIDTRLIEVLNANPQWLATLKGFTQTHVNPQGFRSGAMNELLSNPDQYR